MYTCTCNNKKYVYHLATSTSCRGVAVLLLRCLGHFVDLVYTLDQVVFLLPEFGGQVQL